MASNGSSIRPTSSRLSRPRCEPIGSAAIASSLASTLGARSRAKATKEDRELVRHYEVRVVTAVLRRENFRSLRLLERIGFSLASPELHVEYQVEPGEILMLREVP